MSSNFPAIPDAAPTTQSLLATVQALTEAVRGLTGQNNNPALQAASLQAIEAVKTHNNNNVATTHKTLQDDIDETKRLFNEAIGNLYKAIADWLAGRSSAEDKINVQINSIGDRVGNAESGIFQANVTREKADFALAGQIDSLTGTVGKNAAAFNDFKLVQVDKNTSIAGQLTTITTSVGDNATAISKEATARSDGDKAIGLRIDDLTAKTGKDITAAIQDEAAVRTDAVSAVARTVSTLSATVGDGHSGLVASTNFINEVVNGPAGLSSNFQIQASLDGSVGGIRFQGLKRSGETSATYTTIFDSNVEINGTLLVGKKFIGTEKIDVGAVTGTVDSGVGAGSASCTVQCGAGGSVILVCQMTNYYQYPPNSGGSIIGYVNGYQVVSSVLSRVWLGDSTQFWPQCFVGVWKNTSDSDLYVPCSVSLSPGFYCSVAAIGFKR